MDHNRSCPGDLIRFRRLKMAPVASTVASVLTALLLLERPLWGQADDLGSLFGSLMGDQGGGEKGWE